VIVLVFFEIKWRWVVKCYKILKKIRDIHINNKMKH
jgi:hypothetical protein